MFLKRNKENSYLDALCCLGLYVAYCDTSPGIGAYCDTSPGIGDYTHTHSLWTGHGFLSICFYQYLPI